MNIIFKIFFKMLSLPIVLILILLIAISKFVYSILEIIGIYLMMLFVFLGFVMMIVCKFDQSLGKEGWMAAIFLLVMGFIVSPYGLVAILEAIIDKLDDLKDSLIDF